MRGWGGVDFGTPCRETPLNATAARVTQGKTARTAESTPVSGAEQVSRAGGDGRRPGADVFDVATVHRARARRQTCVVHDARAGPVRGRAGGERQGAGASARDAGPSRRAAGRRPTDARPEQVRAEPGEGVGLHHRPTRLGRPFSDRRRPGYRLGAAVDGETFLITANGSRAIRFIYFFLLFFFKPLNSSAVMSGSV